MLDVPIRVKDALRDGTYPKNYRFNILKNDGTVDFTIDNNTLISESVSFDERMCSGTYLKFGLCEGTSLEFQYFDHPDILGRRIQAFIDVQYKDNNDVLQWHTIPMGFYDVDKCPRQVATGIRKVTAYNKLKSDYLNHSISEEVRDLIDAGEDGTNAISIHSILRSLLSNYAIEQRNIGEATTETHTGSGSLAYKPIRYRKLDGSTSWSYNTGSIQVRNSIVSLSDSEQHPDSYFFVKIKAAYALAMQAFIQQIADTVANDGYELEIYYDGEYVPFWDFINNIHARDADDTFVTFMKGYAYFVPAYESSAQPIAEYFDLCDLASDLETDYHLYSERWFYITIPIDFQGFFSAITNTVDFSNILQAYWLKLSDMDNIRLTANDKDKFTDVSLRDLQAAVYETSCQFGRLDRSTDLFSGIELNRNMLYPQDTLYPANDLFPMGESERAAKSMYDKLWTDEGEIQKFRYLIITYKGLDGEGNEKEYKLQRTVNTHGTRDYNCSDNWLFKNLIWTAEQVGEIADVMAEKMRNLSWFPFEMWCAGLPYLETGDEIEIVAGDNTYTSYVLQRTLKGIQNLQDTYINGELDVF